MKSLKTHITLITKKNLQFINLAELNASVKDN